MKHPRVFIVCSLLVMIALIGTVAFSANSGSSSVPVTAKPAAGAGCGSGSGGCGSTSGGCGAPSAVKSPASPVKLTAMQEKKLAAIDQKGNAQTVVLRAKVMKKRDEATKLIADPKASNATISKAMHELGSIQADLQLVRVFAQRDKDKVYTKEQKAQTAAAAGSSCGCGSSSGGCGSSTPSASQKAK